MAHSILSHEGALKGHAQRKLRDAARARAERRLCDLELTAARARLIKALGRQHPVKVDGEEFLILDSKEILAILKEEK
jgi:hypothetical protein